MIRTFSGKYLRERRLAAGLRPEQLAIAVDRSVYSILRYERGTADPSSATLGALADCLKCSIDDFYAREGVADAA